MDTTPMARTVLGLNAVIVAVTEEVPRILIVRTPGPTPDVPDEDALPFGPLEPETDRTLDRALRRWVREQTGLELGYVEQLYTFGDQERDPLGSRGGVRLDLQTGGRPAELFAFRRDVLRERPAPGVGLPGLRR